MEIGRKGGISSSIKDGVLNRVVDLLVALGVVLVDDTNDGLQESGVLESIVVLLIEVSTNGLCASGLFDETAFLTALSVGTNEGHQGGRG